MNGNWLLKILDINLRNQNIQVDKKQVSYRPVSEINIKRGLCSYATAFLQEHPPFAARVVLGFSPAFVRFVVILPVLSFSSDDRKGQRFYTADWLR